MSQRKSVPLPPGWIQRASKSHPDRVYYFNERTGQSVWDIAEISQILKQPPTSATKMNNKSQSQTPKKKGNHAQKTATPPKGKSAQNNERPPSKVMTRSQSKENLKECNSSQVSTRNMTQQQQQNKSSLLQNRRIAKAKRQLPKKGQVSEANNGNKAKASATESKNLKRGMNGNHLIADDNNDSSDGGETDFSAKKRRNQPSNLVANNKKSSAVNSTIKTNSRSPKNAIQKGQSSTSAYLVDDIIKTSTTLAQNQKPKVEHKTNSVALTKDYKIPKVNKATIDVHATNHQAVVTAVKRADDISVTVAKSFDQVAHTVVDNDDFGDDGMEWEESVEAFEEEQSVDDILAMDVDMFAGYEEEQDGNDSDRITDIRVADTNIYIHNFELLSKIAENEVLAVPWVVIQELDGLKKHTNTRVAANARAAVRWLNQVLKDKEKKVGFMFQKMSEIATVAGAEENADDKILLYCLYLKDLYGDSITLVTNDANLTTKAGIEEVNVLSAQELNSEYKSKEKTSSGANMNKTITSAVEPGHNAASLVVSCRAKPPLFRVRTPTPRVPTPTPQTISAAAVPDQPTSLLQERSRRLSLRRTSEGGASLTGGEEDRDCEHVLLCLTHNWNIFTVISQGLCACFGIPVVAFTEPVYPIVRENAVTLCQQIFHRVNDIWRLYGGLMSRSIPPENFQDLCHNLNSFKKELNILPHEKWKNTPLVNPQQMSAFFEKEKEKTSHGFEQLSEIGRTLQECMRVIQQ
eukprot:TRINITY_DN4459_c0_g1_i7.p1 TRINITY_DN4459_c0_g1~~TRINITY_DN4459_c0_g1_i7.p1  ORF type:complete len:748 (-),score=155.99 TRINITY_DN4459_c0_g1_i7:123-2366(-)